MKLDDGRTRNEPDEYSVSLRFFGDDLDPDELSSLLGSVPSDSARRGDIIQRRTGAYTASQGSWQLRTEVSADSIETQLISLFEHLTSDLSIWQSLTTRFDADLFCGVFHIYQSHCVELSPHLHRILADRNLTLVLDIYASDGPSESA